MKVLGMMPGWLSKGVVLRLMFLTIFLTIFPFLYVNYEAGNSCQLVEGMNNCVLKEDPSSGSSGLWKNHVAFSKEHVELQAGTAANPKLESLWTKKQWKQKVDEFSALFQTLMQKKFLKADWKALCIGAGEGQQVLALQENGVRDAVGIDLIPFPPLVIHGNIHSQPFPDNAFDFEYSNVFHVALFDVNFLSEITRTLKPGGIAVLHLQHDINANNEASLLRTRNHIKQHFGNIQGLQVEKLDMAGYLIEIVMRKLLNPDAFFMPKNSSVFPGNCSFSLQKLQAIQYAEPLIADEPLKPWITLKQNIRKITYLPNLMNVSYYRRHIYVDVGARTYGSSIGSWFMKQYPKKNKNFQIFAIEADTSFASGYRNRKAVTLLPYAAWVRNETLMFGDSRTGNSPSEGAGMGRIQLVAQSTGGLEDGKTMPNFTDSLYPFKSVQGMDFSAWLLRTASRHDYVVMKMDVEGTEFDLLPKMFDTGAICLVDELFLECHYNRWQRCCPERTRKYGKTYSDCLQLFKTLRASGVLVHQWW